MGPTPEFVRRCSRFRPRNCRPQDVHVKSVGTAIAASQFMDANQTHSRPLELDPIEVSTPGDDAARTMGDGSSARAAGQRELRITIADEFLTKVAKEYQEGHIDPALWARVSAQYGNDESLVIAAYLR